MTTYELVRAVLLAHRQEGGVSELSVKQLCQATGRCRRGVQMSLRTMRQQGLLSDGVHLGEGAFIRILEEADNPTQGSTDTPPDAAPAPDLDSVVDQPSEPGPTSAAAAGGDIGDPGQPAEAAA